VWTCNRLSPDTKTLDLYVTNQNLVLQEVSGVLDLTGKEGILIDIPRTNTTADNIPGKR
jgi:hypothetical protein